MSDNDRSADTSQRQLVTPLVSTTNEDGTPADPHWIYEQLATALEAHIAGSNPQPTPTPTPTPTPVQPVEETTMTAEGSSGGPLD